MRILIADDEKEVVEIMRNFLTKKGFSVDIAFDGKKALESIKANHYDLVFLDESMPELTGLEVVEDIRKNNLSHKTMAIPNNGRNPIYITVMGNNKIPLN